ncbi:tetratricopeptide repeat protein, partial [Nocardiopsis prasina]|uniref:tetratricopeptide repeat protein n=1 Tax=Nocardiopsis prasina TaxID=2015 RepID=UPI0004755735
MSDKTPSGSLLAFGVGKYEAGEYNDLPTAIPQVKKLAELFSGSGYTDVVVADPTSADAVQDACEQWAARWRRERDRGPAVLVWSGHAARGPQLVLTGTGPTGTPRNIPLAALTEYLTARTDATETIVPVPYQRLVIVDTCYSGDGISAQIHQEMERLKETSQSPEAPHVWLGYIASCWPRERAEGAGALINTINHLLQHGPETEAEGRYSVVWSPNNKFLTGNDLLDAVGRAWLGSSDNKPIPVTAGTADRMFLNPRWSGPARPRLIDAHLAEAARSGGSIDADEWFFTGRRTVLSQVTEWMADPRPGLCLVTGPAGSGKSAVVGHIAALSNPQTRTQVMETPGWDHESPDPGEGIVYTTLHLRGLDATGIAKELAKAFGFPEPGNPTDLLAELKKTPKEVSPIVVLDGLDEAVSDDLGWELVSRLIQPLSEEVRLLLASRPRSILVQSTGEDGQPQRVYRPLRDLLAQQAVSARPFTYVDLAEQRSTRDDIRKYVIRRLSRVDAATEERAHTTASALVVPADDNDGGFLFARITVDWLSHRSPAEWATDLPTTITEAFEADISVLSGGPVPRELLSALAWGRGRGVPVDIWCAITGALHPHRSYERADVERCLARFRRYIVEDGDGERPIYRLFHQEFIQYLRGLAPTTDDASPEEAVAVKLAGLAREILDAVGEDSPNVLPRYLWVHLVEHAQEAGYAGISALREIAERYPQTFLPGLAGSLHNLAIRLSEEGQREEALAPSQESVNIRRTLAEQDPATYFPDLAGSLDNLGNQLAELGRYEEALINAQQAVTISRTLAEQDPATYFPDLAGSLDNLGNQLAELGRYEEALINAQQAVTISRTLAEQDPATYFPDLAGSLNNFGNRLAEIGRHQEALEPAQEAVAIRRSLATKNPAAYLPNLAMALTNLGNRLAEIGRHQEALEPAQEAAQIYRYLVEQNPAAYLPNLATVLDNFGNRLAETGRHQEALEPAQEAAQIYRYLVEQNPAAYLPNLAGSLNNLGNRLAEIGRHQEALEPAQEAVAIRRSLATKNPAAYLPNLAGSLNDLATVRAKIGQHEEALESTQEAAQLFRSLVEQIPAAYLPNLATVLNNLGNQMAELGYYEEALNNAREAAT